MEEENIILPFDIPTDTPRIIKVIGVGGGGSNAVQNMYREGIHNVTFVLCNTDCQALVNSDIPVKVQLGRETTKGLGAGNDPSVAKQAAEESIDDIKALFKDETQMVFVTAGMGGGTGTGAAPVVAHIAKEMGVLTIGIVTIPFRFELTPKIKQALKGVEEISKSVDALLVINNERLLEIYPELDIEEGFKKVDEVLTVATKSIAEIITTKGTINLDFRDVSKILKNGGVAIMSYGIGTGTNRLADAISKAQHSPLLNDNDIYNSQKILFNIYHNSVKPLKVGEMEELNKFMNKFKSNEIEVIWGLTRDDNLKDDEVKITLLATGFGVKNVPGMEVVVEEQQQLIEAEQKQEEESKKEEDKHVNELYNSWYKNQKTIRSFVFEDSDLMDESLINNLENSPTYQRTADELSLLKKSRNENNKEES